MDLTWLVGGTAAAGLVAACWAQVKAFYYHLIGLAICTIDCENDCASVAASTLRSARWSKSAPNRMWDMVPLYFPAMARQLPTVIETPADSGELSFFGRTPIWIRRAALTFGYNHVIRLRITFIRGTLDKDQLARFLQDAGRRARSRQRFTVIHHHGRDPQTMMGSGSEPGTLHGGSAQFFVPVVDADKLQLDPPSDPYIERMALNAHQQQMVDEIEYWLEMEKWHHDHGVPWKRNYALVGLPGSGKSSIVRAISYKHRLPLHVFHLTSLSSRELQEQWAQMTANVPTIALFEDLDAVFEGRESKNSRLSFDDLLNCLDGVDEAQGVLTFITTNRPECLDVALAGEGKETRPGRVDQVVRFEYLDEEGKRKIANRLLADFPEEIETLLENESPETGAQFQLRCWRRVKELVWRHGCGRISARSSCGLSVS